VTPTIGGFKWGRGSKGVHGHPNLAANKFPEIPSGASRMQENLSAALAVTRTPLGDFLQHFRRPSN